LIKVGTLFKKTIERKHIKLITDEKTQKSKKLAGEYVTYYTTITH
jgi:hypothetical protein